MKARFEFKHDEEYKEYLKVYFAIQIHAALVAKGSYGYATENAIQSVQETNALIKELIKSNE